MRHTCIYIQLFICAFFVQDNCALASSFLSESSLVDSIGVNKPSAHVPVLCYHQVRQWEGSDDNTARVYITSDDVFSAQMKLLHDSGYHTILPDQLIAHINTGAPLPEKPIMLTFDDGTLSQYQNALPVLTEYGFKAVFFIMSVSIGKPRFVNKSQIAELSAKGHVIGAHTWDHKNVKKYALDDWGRQISQPKKLLESITGKPVVYFAYPFGVWSKEAVDRLNANRYVGAFQLAGKGDNANKLFTINRILVDGHWNTKNFLSALKR